MNDNVRKHGQPKVRQTPDFHHSKFLLFRNIGGRYDKGRRSPNTGPCPFLSLISFENLSPPARAALIRGAHPGNRCGGGTPYRISMASP